MMLAAILAAMLVAAPLAAQAPAPAADPARLAAAHALVDQLLPPDRREAMIEGMTRPQMDRMREAVEQSPEMQAAIGKDPHGREALAKFMDRYFRETIDLTRQSMPKMMDAMAVAYARLFSLAELNDVRAFYMTPSGRAFMDKQAAVMADPAIGAVQREMMAAQMAKVPAMMAQIEAEFGAHPESKKP